MSPMQHFSRLSFDDRTFCRDDGVASLSKAYSGGATTRARETTI
ncbi:hypothetical protein ACNKHX_13380 [Shigella flexneri]